MQVHNAWEKNTSCNLGVYFYIFYIIDTWIFLYIYLYNIWNSDLNTGSNHKQYIRQILGFACQQYIRWLYNLELN